MLAIVVFMYMDPRFLQIFKKILIFKVPVIKKMTALRQAHSAEIADFLELDF